MMCVTGHVQSFMDFQQDNRPKLCLITKCLGVEMYQFLFHINASWFNTYKCGKFDPRIPERNQDMYNNYYNSSRNIRLTSKYVLFRLTYNNSVITYMSI
jgi:hypothetical protein